ncbi:hypothetical protein FGO68_gene10148 [Halteria grandinella]|uniref:Chromo domain-containing protein n=1 Tax=Halteria grandinella TaxID=5974 RepID=A0A8J8N9K7_HALGN|nr:hypothetical protein FGO68_gene10148 [Halteria grandinella]
MSKRATSRPHPCESVQLYMEGVHTGAVPEDEQMFEVDKILAKAVREGVTYYQVQWKMGNNPEEGGGRDDSITWEPEENLESVAWMIEEFNQAVKVAKQAVYNSKSMLNNEMINGKFKNATRVPATHVSHQPAYDQNTDDMIIQQSVHKRFSKYINLCNIFFRNCKPSPRNSEAQPRSLLCGLKHPQLPILQEALLSFAPPARRSDPPAATLRPLQARSILHRLHQALSLWQLRH